MSRAAEHFSSECRYGTNGSPGDARGLESTVPGKCPRSATLFSAASSAAPARSGPADPRESVLGGPRRRRSAAIAAGTSSDGAAAIVATLSMMPPGRLPRCWHAIPRRLYARALSTGHADTLRSWPRAAVAPRRFQESPGIGRSSPRASRGPSSTETPSRVELAHFGTALFFPAVRNQGRNNNEAISYARDRTSRLPGVTA